MTNWKDQEGKVWEIEKMPYRYAQNARNFMQQRKVFEVDPLDVRNYRNRMPVNEAATRKKNGRLWGSPKYRALRKREAQGQKKKSSAACG